MNVNITLLTTITCAERRAFEARLPEAGGCDWDIAWVCSKSEGPALRGHMCAQPQAAERAWGARRQAQSRQRVRWLVGPPNNRQRTSAASSLAGGGSYRENP